MRKRETFFIVFFIFLFLSLVILGLSILGNLKVLSSFLEKPVLRIQSLSYDLFQKLPFVSEDLKIKRLKDENFDLLSKIIDQERLQKENVALSDQFQTSYPQSSKLLKARVIGAPGFVPGVSLPVSLILNKGSKDNLRVGEAVVVKNNLVGIITKVSVNLSKVDIINNPFSSFTAKTENGAYGIVKGSGGGLTLNNVLLSENIKSSEIVLTYGDTNSEGIGVPPSLVVGKITSVEKNPSDLFQKAKVESFVDFTRLSTVFIYINTK